MPNVNSGIIFLGIVLLVIVIGLTVYVLSYLLSNSRKMTRARLEKYKDRFTGNKDRTDISKRRAIRMAQKSTGISKVAESFIPRPTELKLRLSRTGKKIELSHYSISMALVALGVGLLVLTLSGNIVFGVLIGIACGLGLPHMWVGKKIKKRQAVFIKQFPEALDLVVRGLKSGLPVNEAIINVGEEIPAPVGQEFTRVSDDVKLGKTLEDALWDASARVEVPDFKFFIISLSVQRETGGNLGETLQNLSQILRQRQQMKLKIKAMSSEAKASAWIVGVLPFIMLGLIMLLNFDYGIILFTHPTAKIAAMGALLWMSLGVFVMKQMIDFET